MYKRYHILAVGCWLLVIGFGLLTVSCRQTTSTPPEILASFEQLEATLDSVESYREVQEKKLLDYKRKAAEASSDEARFYHYKLITELYYEFDVDSTSYYVQKNLEIATRNNKPEWKVDCYLQAAHVCNCTGFLEQSRSALDNLQSLPKTPDQQILYYIETMDYWSNRAIFLNLPSPDPMCQAYADSLLQMGNRVPVPLQAHAKVWRETDDARKVELIGELKQIVGQMSPSDVWYARLCGEIGLLSHYLHTSELDEVDYLTRQVMASLRNVSRVAPLLFFVQQSAMRHGELEYATRFLTALVQMQQDYPDRVRQPLYSHMTQLNAVTNNRLEHVSARNYRLMLAATAMCLIMTLSLVLAVYNLRRRVRLQSLLNQRNRQLVENTDRLKQEQKALREANEALRQASAELKEEGSRLREANYLKEEYVGEMFATCSEYLQKIEAVKRDVNRKLTARQYDLALQATKVKSENDMKEQHELWAKFDDIFLRLFPDFVEQFNELLRPEERITLRQGEKLNTDLRIYAMVRLGISSSTKIAKILGLSTQSVYNARQKMRARATLSDEEFAARVRRLAINHNLIDGGQEMK